PLQLIGARIVYRSKNGYRLAMALGYIQRHLRMADKFPKPACDLLLGFVHCQAGQLDTAYKRQRNLAIAIHADRRRWEFIRIQAPHSDSVIRTEHIGLLLVA